MNKKEILIKQILNEQQKTNQLLQTLISMQRPVLIDGIRIDEELAKDIRLSWRCN
ncbi:hypothetical protein [Carnobacterium maltaromaticum]|uniref:hypothetical protein n=1 Tax=Carnobacterium maltaromaticum TaxID=2751 RepID=UPI0039B074FC